jgi:hypothetical protein
LKGIKGRKLVSKTRYGNGAGWRDPCLATCDGSTFSAGEDLIRLRTIRDMIVRHRTILYQTMPHGIILHQTTLT